MNKLIWKFSLLQLLLISCGTPKPIEEVVVQAFDKKTGIMVHSKEVADLDVYQVLEFPEEEKNRNHYGDRGTEDIAYLVMHYTVCNFPATMRLFTSDIPEGRVSAHYVVTEEERERDVQGGMVFQVVPEEKTAWHAGISYWRGEQGLNLRSIGVENVNKGFVGKESEYPNWFTFDKKQIRSLGTLSQYIVNSYNIAPQNVVGHADIAPTRKQDPGILFPWEKLYTHYGVGAWLTEDERDEKAIAERFTPKEKLPQGISEAFLLTCLQAYGYNCTEVGYMTPENTSIVKAFKAHFSRNQYPYTYDASIDRTDMLWVWGLSEKYK
ncbi:hypothetical protein Aasi_0795 [Candidatus Amoebophilus asiaticus 5a2]|uniref:N-acetylmuramoyl-L-alanine amidase n=1 Tax=Amoebophilus asiaticus (strain 5a2) TaxID=452471 RepID=B3ESH1_AMOA5|nr:N-acetylmuramoyl-L-alanine amidase [Candidatus Amoebophilus asiaticus]ACE06173.1 hypothetical protein Aasi_0795 [Candidatus Amoebophilus asiaticus 5a2]